MLVGYNRLHLDWDIIVSNGADFVGPPTGALEDNFPSVPQRFTWNTNAIHEVRLVGTPDTPPTVDSGYYAVLVDNVSFPVGTVVAVQINTGVSTHILVNTVVVLTASGKKSACVLFPPQAAPYSVLTVFVTIQDLTIAPATPFDIGEIWAGPLVRLGLTKLDIKLVDGSIENRAANNQARKLFEEPYRVTTATLANRVFSSSFETEKTPAPGALPADLQSILYGMVTTAMFLIVPRYLSIDHPGQIDNTMVNSLAQLVTSGGVGSISGVASDDVWPATLTFNEVV